MLRKFQALVAMLALWTPALGGQSDQSDIVRALLERSRLLKDVQFTIPVGLYRQYLREVRGVGTQLPVSMIAESAEYRIEVPARGAARLLATIQLRIFQPAACGNVPVLSTKRAWKKVTIQKGAGEPEKVSLPAVGGFLRFSPPDAGVYVISAEAPLPEPAGRTLGGSLKLPVCRTVATRVRLDSPAAWDVTVADLPVLDGSVGKKTDASFALTPRRVFTVSWRPAGPKTEHAPRFALSGAVAWGIDGGRSAQMEAELDVAVVGGSADMMELRLPPSAERLAITGPDVRETQVSPDSAKIFFRGKITGLTRLRVSCRISTSAGAMKLGALSVRDGSWSGGPSMNSGPPRGGLRGGTLIVNNLAPGTELLASAAQGLSEISPEEVPESALALASGQPALTYAITGRDWSVDVEAVNLGELAMRESIADMAHFQFVYLDDGTMMVLAGYEIRNRTRQFVRLDVPPGSQPLSVKVNDKPSPATPITGSKGAYLLPLVRSPASMKGLVSFPVEVAYVTRTGRDRIIPLPRIDVPIAYAWCEAYLPEGVTVKGGTGLKPVPRYSSETAVAQLGYGRGLREPQPAPSLSRGGELTAGAARAGAGAARLNRSLGLNYYQVGRDAYERNDFAAAEAAFNKAIEYAPASHEGENAKKYLANIRLATGRVESALKTKQERISGKIVQMEQAAANQPAARQQQEFLEKGLQAAREGKLGEAKVQFQAAGISGGGGGSVQAPQLSYTRSSSVAAQAREEYARIRKKEEEEAGRLRQQVRELRERGKAEQALAVSKQLGDLSSSDEDRKISEELAVEVSKRPRLAEPGQPPLTKLSSGPMAANAPLPMPSPTVAAPGSGVIELKFPATVPASELRPMERPAPEIIAALKDQVRVLRDQAKYEEAISVLGNIRRLDPDDAWAKEWEEQLTRFAWLRKARSYNGVNQVTDLAAESPPSIERYDELRYPRDWPEITLKRQAGGAGELADRPVTRTYDVRDLIVHKPQFAMPQGESAGTEARLISLEQSTKEITNMVRRTVTQDDWAKNSGTVGSIRESNGQLIVTQTAENQHKVAQLLDRLRSVRGGQVEQGSNIAAQRAKGAVYGVYLDDVDVDQLYELKRFGERNYDWADEAPSRNVLEARSVGVQGDLAEKLRRNLGQKVPVGSMNLMNVDAASAEAVGVRFRQGGNNLSYAVIDEGQFLTLREFNSRGGRAEQVREQEAIVGSDALLANGMLANVAFAADKGNTLDIAGNPVALPLDQYILVNNGAYVTAVKAQSMRNWMAEATAPTFAEVPWKIELPRVGRLEKFEKTLVQPGEPLSITLKGDAP